MSAFRGNPYLPGGCTLADIDGPGAEPFTGIARDTCCYCGKAITGESVGWLDGPWAGNRGYVSAHLACKEAAAKAGAA